MQFGGAVKNSTLFCSALQSQLAPVASRSEPKLKQAGSDLESENVSDRPPTK
jgi:hypothetical protein